MLDLAHTRHVHPAHMPRGMMALGWSTPVFQNILTVQLYVPYLVPITCLWSDFHTGEVEGIAVGLQARRLLNLLDNFDRGSQQHSTFVSTTLCDTCEETSGQFPAVFV